MGYSPWDHKESDTTEQLTHTHTHTHRLPENYHQVSSLIPNISTRKIVPVYHHNPSLL